MIVAKGGKVKPDFHAGRSGEAILVESATGTLGKLMAILDCIAGAAEPLRFSDLLAVTAEPRGTLHRHLKHLMAEGMVEAGEDGRYRVGLRLLNLAARAWAGNDLRTVARPHLERLSAATGETVHLGILRGAEIIYIDKVEGRQAVRMYSAIGNASPVYCTGIGKAALSVLPEDSFQELVRQLSFHRFTEATIADVAGLCGEIASIRSRGVSFDMEEHERGIRCVAVPLCAGGVFGGVSVTAPAYRADREKLQSWQAPLKVAAREIARDMEVRMAPRS